MDKKKWLILGAALIIIGAAAAFLITSKDDSTETSNQSSTQPTDTSTQNQSTKTETATEGNLKTLANGGKAQECSLSYSDSNGEGTGKMYTDGKGRGLMSLELKTARGNTGEANTLVTSGKIYSWTKTAAGGGIGFVFDVDAVQTNSTGSPTTSNSQTAGKNFSMQCKSWDVDEAVLAVPTDVKFSTLPTSPQ